MDPAEIGRRIGEVLRGDRDRGRLAPLSSYQRRFPGCEEIIARVYEVVAEGGEAGVARGGESPAAAAPDASPVPPPSRYRQLGEIARGGMGAILRVRDEALDRELAMKVVLGEDPTEPGSPAPVGPLTRRFLVEAKITARLDHPGVVPVHELGADEQGRPYFTMKLIRGGQTLAEVFRRAHGDDPEFTLPRVVQIFVRILEALAFAHQKGIIHRDLKPANVMVGDFGEVYVMDWGLAKVVGEADEPLNLPGRPEGAATGLTEAGQILGTPAYMPIEQARNEALDARADVYAVGAMLYEFLGGVHPFGDRGQTVTTGQILVGLVTGPPAALAGLAPRAPPEILSIVNKAMARERTDRYATAAEFARDLRSFVEGRVVRAHEAGAWAEIRKWIGRNRALAGASATALLLLVAGLVASITLGLKADRERDAARRYAYRATIGAASADLVNQDLYAARLRLTQAPEDLRGWEWRHLFGRLDESLQVFEGTGMAFAPSGALRVIDPAGVVREYDLSRGTSRELARVAREGAEAWVSSDGDAVCSVRERPGERDTYDVSFADLGGGAAAPTVTLRIWDRKWNRGFRMPNFIYTGLDRRVHVRDAYSGAEMIPASLRDGPEAVLMAIASGPGGGDGRFLLVQQGSEALAFDVEADRILLRTGYPRYARPSAMALDPAHARLALLGEDGGVEIREVATGGVTAFGRVEAHAQEGFVCFDPTGRMLATGGKDRAVRLFDSATGALIRTLRGHMRPVEEGAFTPDGEYLVTRDAGSEVRVWAARGTDPTVFRGHASYIYAVAFSPDGSRVYSGGWDGFVDQGGALRIWDVATGTPVAALGDAADGSCIFSLALTRDGKRIVATGGVRPEFRGGPLRVWDAETGRIVTECPGTYRALCLHPDGRRAVGLQFGASFESEGDVFHVLDIGSGALLGSFLPKPVVWAAYSVDPACSPDGHWIATSSADATEVILWDAATCREDRRLALGGGQLASITFSPDGTRLLTTATDESWSVWEVATGARITMQTGTGNEVLTGKFAPDGRWILTGGRDRMLRLWDARTFEEIARLPGHDDYIKSVDASHDGEILATASGDRTVRIWQTRTAAQIHVAQIERRRLAAELGPEVEALFGELEDAHAVVAKLRATRHGRALEVALQIALAESVARAAAEKPR